MKEEARRLNVFPFVMKKLCLKIMCSGKVVVLAENWGSEIKIYESFKVSLEEIKSEGSKKLSQNKVGFLVWKHFQIHHF